MAVCSKCFRPNVNGQEVCMHCSAPDSGVLTPNEVMERCVGAKPIDWCGWVIKLQILEETTHLRIESFEQLAEVINKEGLGVYAEVLDEFLKNPLFNCEIWGVGGELVTVVPLGEVIIDFDEYTKVQPEI